MSSYYGPLRGEATAAVGGGVFFQDANVEHVVLDPNDAVAQISIRSAGDVTATGEATYTWLFTGVNSDYEAKADVTSGSLSSGTTGSWLSLASTRNWSRTRTVFGTSSVTMTIRVRRVSDSVELDVITVSLTATVDA